MGMELKRKRKTNEGYFGKLQSACVFLYTRATLRNFQIKKELPHPEHYNIHKTLPREITCFSFLGCVSEWKTLI